MHYSYKLALAVAILLLATCFDAYAQGGRRSDYVLYPQTFPPRYIGVEGGFAEWFSKGNFTIGESTVPCVAFTKGSGGQLVGGIKSLLYLNKWLILSPRISYENRSTTYSTALADEPARDASNQIITLQQDARSEVTFSSFTFDMRLAVDIARTGIYVSAGGAASKLMGGTYDYSERVLSPGNFRYVDTKANEHQLVSAKTFENLQKYAIDLRGGVGYLFTISRRFTINPEISYNFPLTYLVGAPNSVKQQGVIATIGFLYNLNVEDY